MEAAWDQAPEKSDFVFPDEHRRRAQKKKKMGWANANLRTMLEKLIRRAGVEPWPRLWHSMRASCETDLARHFPLSSVAKWLGNTQAVAMRNDVDVTDADFNRAAKFVLTDDEKAVQNPAQQGREMGGLERKSDTSSFEGPSILPENSLPCDSMTNAETFPTGFEPVTFSFGGNENPAVCGIKVLIRKQFNASSQFRKTSPPNALFFRVFRFFAEANG
ncbi:hypothetical protein K2X85_20800 [bacterium]|nr:hypothetical protein [bacterium]